jgi:hypothetical protein
VLRACFGAVALHGLRDRTPLAIPIGLELPIPMLHRRFIDLMIPELWPPIPALIIGLTGLSIPGRLLREADRALEATHA